MSPDSVSLQGNAANVTLLARQPHSKEYYKIKGGGVEWRGLVRRTLSSWRLPYFLSPLISANTPWYPPHHPSITTPNQPPRQDGSAGAAAERGEDRRRQALRRRTRNLIQQHQSGLVAPRGSVTLASERGCVTNQVVTARTERARAEDGKVSCACGAAAAAASPSSIIVVPPLELQNAVRICPWIEN